MLVKRAIFLLNAAFAIAKLDLISQVYLPSFVKMLPKYLKDSTFSSCFPPKKNKKKETVFKIKIQIFWNVLPNLHANTRNCRLL
jgi:hypothetical protein